MQCPNLGAAMSLWLKFVAILSFCLIGTTQAQTPDPINGKTLYNTAVSGLSCGLAGCHGADPSLNINRVRNGANNPTIIQNAINSNIGGMALYTGRFTAAQLADIAAYIANPNIPNGPIARLSATAIKFSDVLVGGSAAPIQITLANYGTTNLNITSLAITGINATEFNFSTTCGTILTTGSICTVTTIFSPKSSGLKTASLAISHDATGGISTVALTGSGVDVSNAAIALSASTVDYGTVLVGSQTSKGVTILNTGTVPVTITSPSTTSSITGAVSYASTCESMSPLSPGASCTMTFTLQAPLAPGIVTASHTFTSNASSGQFSINLIGTVVSAIDGPISVTPSSWNYGFVTLGTSVSKTFTISGSGTTIYRIYQGGNGNPAFSISGCPDNTIIVISCDLTITYTPTVAKFDTADVAIYTSSKTNPVELVYPYGRGATTPQDPFRISLSPATQDFGTAKVYSSGATKIFTITNIGKPDFIYSGAYIGGADVSGFVVNSDGTCVFGLNLKTSESCTLNIGFSPTLTGLRIGILYLYTTQGDVFSPPYFDAPTATLTGTGVTESNGLIEFTQDGLAVSSVKVSADGKVTKISLKNNGAATIKVTNIAFLVNKNNYRITDECSGKTLKRGATCEIKLQYIGPALLAGAAAPAAEMITISTDNGAQKTVPISLTPVDVTATSNSATPNTGGCTIGEGDDVDLSHLAMLAVAMGALLARRKSNKV
jgi:hypothetical protein